MGDEETTGLYGTYANLDLEHAHEFRDEASELHHEATHLEAQAADAGSAGRTDDAKRLAGQGEALEAKADDDDRRAGLLEDAAGLWREATADERRSNETRVRADAAFETKFDLNERINHAPLTDDEITELRVQAGRAGGEEAALRERSTTLEHEAAFDRTLADEDEAAAYRGLTRPERPVPPEPEPNPDLMPLE